MSAFLTLPRVLQLLVCAYCEDVRETSDGPMNITLFHDGFQAKSRFYGVPYYQFVFLPDWSPVEVHFYDTEGKKIVMQNEKMRNHKPGPEDNVTIVCNHVRAPSVNDPFAFTFQEVNKWWVSPCIADKTQFPLFLMNIVSYVVYKNTLREFV